MSPLASQPNPLPIGPDGPAILSLALPPSAARLDDLLCEPFSLAALCLAARTLDPTTLWNDGVPEYLFANAHESSPSSTLEPLRVSIAEYATEVACLDGGSPRSRLIGTLAAMRWTLADDVAANVWPIPSSLRISFDAIDLPMPEAVAAGADPHLFPILQVARLTERPNLPALSAWIVRESLRVVRSKSPPVGRIIRPRVEWSECPYLDALVGEFVTRQRKAADECVRSMRGLGNAQAERLRDAKLEALVEFAAGASHEINNPLAVIVGQTQLLRGKVEAGALPHLESISRQARRVHEILREVMAFAEPPPARPALFDLDALALECWAAMSDDRGVKIALDPLGWAALDAVLTRQAFAAVLRNAWQASPENGTVSVWVDRADLIVEDAGLGFDEATARHIFDPFYSGRSAGRGRGLGLSAAWSAMRQQGGTIRHLRAEGRTRFILSFPAGSIAAAESSAVAA